ncbi:MAG: EVE domain-containing protein [Chloroflexi bacterium]|nr:EVE domain-containing protein [Chloroflexota bacterium]
MIVSSERNFIATRRRRFTVQGIKSRHRARAARIAPGDRLCWYVTGRAVFAATATVRSPVFVGRERIWISDGKPDPYPWRVRIAKDAAVPPRRGVPAGSLRGRLRFVKRREPHWTLAFQGNLHELVAADFALIERAVRSAMSP